MGPSSDHRRGFDGSSGCGGSGSSSSNSLLVGSFDREVERHKAGASADGDDLAAMSNGWVLEEGGHNSIRRSSSSSGWSQGGGRGNRRAKGRAHSTRRKVRRVDALHVAAGAADLDSRGDAKARRAES